MDDQSLKHDPQPTPICVDRIAAARLLGVSAGTITNLVKSGELASLKIGARRLFRVADLAAFVESRKAVQQ